MGWTNVHIIYQKAAIRGDEGTTSFPWKPAQTHTHTQSIFGEVFLKDPFLRVVFFSFLLLLAMLWLKLNRIYKDFSLTKSKETLTYFADNERTPFIFMISKLKKGLLCSLSFFILYFFKKSNNCSKVPTISSVSQPSI